MDTPITQPVADEVRHWQVGDLFTLGASIERKLVVNVTANRVEVIAESGWYNWYGHQPQLSINYIGRVPLEYNYRGREPLYRDFAGGAFDGSFLR